jgi:hypothetical protein
LEEEQDTRPHTYSFSGRIHPERYGWGIGEPYEVIIQHHDGASSWLRITIAASQVNVTVHTNGDDSVLDMKNRVTRLVRILADSIGFVTGSSLDVEVISCIAPDGSAHVFNTAFDGLIEYEVGSEESQRVFNVLIAQAGSSRFVRMALSDLRSAIREPLDTCVNCYRAVESIRQEYLEGGDSDKGAVRRQSWERLRGAVGVSEEETNWLAEQATPRRHGNPIDATHAERERALRLAWRVVEQHCLNRGKQAETGENVIAEADGSLSAWPSSARGRIAHRSRDIQVTYIVVAAPPCPLGRSTWQGRQRVNPCYSVFG